MNLLITTARSLGCVSTISDSTKFASKLNRPRTTIRALVFDPLLPSAFSRARCISGAFGCVRVTFGCKISCVRPARNIADAHVEVFGCTQR